MRIAALLEEERQKNKELADQLLRQKMIIADIEVTIEKTMENYNRELEFADKEGLLASALGGAICLSKSLLGYIAEEKEKPLPELVEVV